MAGSLVGGEGRQAGGAKENESLPLRSGFFYSAHYMPTFSVANKISAEVKILVETSIDLVATSRLNM